MNNETKCISDGSIYTGDTGDPYKYRCEKCGGYWLTKEEVPVCGMTNETKALKIIQKCDVLFRNGEICAVRNFEVKCSGGVYADILAQYIKDNFVFWGGTMTNKSKDKYERNGPCSCGNKYREEAERLLGIDDPNPNRESFDVRKAVEVLEGVLAERDSETRWAHQYFEERNENADRIQELQKQVAVAKKALEESKLADRNLHTFWCEEADRRQAQIQELRDELAIAKEDASDMLLARKEREMKYTERIKKLFESQEGDNYIMFLAKIDGEKYGDFIPISLPASREIWERAYTRMCKRLKGTINLHTEGVDKV